MLFLHFSSRIEIVAIVLVLFHLSGCSASSMQKQSGVDYFSEEAVRELVLAAERGDVDKIDYLINQQGIDANSTGVGGTTPLAWALSSQNYQGAEALLKLGADPNQQFEKGYTPMWFAAGGENSALLELLLQYDGNPDQWKGTSNLLMLAVRHERMDNYELLLEYGADINSHDYLSNSVATYSVYRERYDILHRVLLDGYSYNLTDLAQLVERASKVIPQNQTKWVNTVRAELQLQGVEYPLPPTPKAEPIRLTEDVRKKLERWEKEGKLPPNSKGAALLKQDRAISDAP